MHRTKRDLTNEKFLQHVQLEPFHQLWEHLRPLRAWCATRESIQTCLRQDALLVLQDSILRIHHHLNVRPAMPANILRQGKPSALNVHPEHFRLLRPLARAVHLELIQTCQAPQHHQRVCRAIRANILPNLGLLTARYAPSAHTLGYRQPSAHHVTLERTRFNWVPHLLLPACSV